MQEGTTLSVSCITPGQTSLLDTFEMAMRTCMNCKPLTPITCTSSCKTWKLKNEFRKLDDKARKPEFMLCLLNTLKNERRLHLLGIIGRERCSIAQIQRELQKHGFNHSQETIWTEYLSPLMEVGLADEHQNLYDATLFGQRIGHLMRGFKDFERVLSPHSECYEEKVLDTLLKRPLTHEGVEMIVPENSSARVLSRLQKAELVETSNERDYVFFFATKRDPNGSDLSPTERRVYETLPKEGISARKLAREAKISIRRTYKYLRKLKGRKLVFVRRKPNSYMITAKGIKIAKMLKGVYETTAEAASAAALLVGREQVGDERKPQFEFGPTTRRE